MKEKVQLITGGLSLLALLAYTLVHTGGLLARYIHPAEVGYIAAFGIEAAIVSLSLRIGELRKSNQSSGFFVFVLVSVVVVSAISNIAEGFYAIHNEALTLTTVKELDAVQGIIGLAATGLISLIVLALSEIIGTDVQTVVKLADKERQAIEKRLAKEASNPEQQNQFPYPIEQAQAKATEQARLTKTQRLDKMVDILRTEPSLGPSELSKRLNISRTTTYDYLSELEGTGRIHTNGNGLQVIG